MKVAVSRCLLGENCKYPVRSSLERCRPQAESAVMRNTGAARGSNWKS